MNLEHYIKTNRNAFDDQEPAAGHFERFVGKRKKRRHIKFRARNIWWKAAILAGVLIGTGFFINYLREDCDECCLSSEIETICDHYEDVMNQEIAHLKVLLNDVEPAVRIKVLNDVEAMKSDTKELLQQVCNGINEEQALSIIKMNYELKIKNIQFISSVVEETAMAPLG